MILGDRLAQRWRLWLVVAWIVAALLLVNARWDAIRWFSLGDTDDNMRMMQVRALLAGQSWFDLRQYRLDPPFGADIHWSRLVDLPIAGIKLMCQPLIGGKLAEKVAVTLAPMLPMAVAMTSMTVIARRLISPTAFALALIILFFAQSARGMWVPLRIDHHGWQLAMLSLVALALTDHKTARGGVLLGVASALSLTIGLEMLAYLGAAGGIAVLMWAHDRHQTRRLAGYGASLSGGTALGYLVFASEANRAPVCDALSPMWLSAMVAGGALCLVLALLNPKHPGLRLAAAALGGVALAGAMAWMWPQCLGRLEGVSPEAQRLWLDRVREARPIYTHGTRTIIAVITLPLIGLAGYGLALWKGRGDAALFRSWIALALLALLAAALLLWQTRAGPAAQLLAIPGATALGWALLVTLRRSPSVLVRVVGVVAALVLVSGMATQFIANRIPDPDANSPRSRSIALANRSCPTLAALRPIALLPRGYVLTFVDLAPRLITVTHHDSVAGPYHRNDDAIVDVMRTFRGSADEARQRIMRRGIDYVLICPRLSESTVYEVQAPNGFYMQLATGKVPAWLQPIPLPQGSPYRIWRVRR